MSILHVKNRMGLSSALIGIIFFGIFLFYMSRLQPEVAFMDSLRYLTYVGNSFDGTSSIFGTWSQGEHRGYLVQLGTYVNAKLFDFNVIGAAYLCGVVIFVTGWILAIQQFQLGQRFAIATRKIVLLVALTFFTLFSFANWELYSLDVGVYIYLKNLVFILFWIFLIRTLIGNAVSKPVAGYILFSIPFIILTVSYGWGYAFAIASIFMVSIISLDDIAKRFRAFLIIFFLLSLGAYAIAGFVVPTDMGKATLQNASIAGSIIGIFFAISSIFMGQESSVAIGIGNIYRIAFSVIFILFLCYLLFTNFKRRRDLFIPLILIVYSGLHILAVSYARGQADPVQAMAPRYYLDFSLLAIGFFWIFLFTEIKNWYLQIVGYGFVLAFILGQLFTCMDEYRKAPHRHESFLKMKASTLAGYISSDEAERLQQPLDRALKGIDVQRRFGLGPFREIECNSPYFLTGHFPDKWVGANSRFLLRNCSSEVAIGLYLPPHFPSKSFTVSTGEGLALAKVNLDSGVNKILRINTRNLPLILDLNLSVAKTNKPSELQLGVTDTRDLGVLVTSVKSK